LDSIGGLFRLSQLQGDEGGSLIERSPATAAAACVGPQLQAVPTCRRRPRRAGHRTCAASTRWATWPPSPTTRQATSTRTVPTSSMEHSPEVDATT